MAELKRLTELADLDRCWEASHERPMWLFKHSLACGVSHSALARFEAFAAEHPESGYALIEVQTARPLSHEVARRSGVRHESPQVLLLRDGAVLWHASHWRIEGARLGAAMAELAEPAAVGS